MDNKVCSVCENTLPIDNFERRSDTGNLRPECKMCRSRKKIAAKHGIPVHVIQTLHYVQDGRCAICGKTADQITHTNAIHNPLTVDHCHDRDVVRGLLCPHCNTGLGAFRDDPRILLKAIEYLLRSS